MKDIIITIPAKTKWEVYKKELEKAENGEILNFKTSNFPKESGPGCRCYVVYKGNIVGWMEICGFSEKNFTCTTTGRKFAGKFIERTGKFHIIDPIPHKGFQGFRYYESSPNI